MSQAIKTACLTWLRFGRQMPYTATEAGHFKADVFGASAHASVEIEVKTELYDLRRDFEKNKHRYYAGKEGILHTSLSGWVPNRLYFAVPVGLKDAALKELEQLGPQHGLLVHDPAKDAWAAQSPWKQLAVVKRAQPLHDAPPPRHVLEDLLLRMGSDSCHFHMMRARYGDLFDEMSRLSQALTAPKEAPEP